MKTPLHPEKPACKIIKVGEKIFVSLEDFKKFQDKEVRLMHLSTIIMNKEGRLTSPENEIPTNTNSIKNLPKINWVTDGVKTRILMPDGVWKSGIAENNITKLKKETIIQFERFGFCKFHGINKEKNEYEFWFTHD
jgi:hypothetical protein